MIHVGEDPASEVYVTDNRRACNEAGIVSKTSDLPADTSEAALLKLIDELNDDTATDGILVKQTLPGHKASQTVNERNRPDKAEDGIHFFFFG